jgi:ubiquinone biosynthesis protein
VWERFNPMRSASAAATGVVHWAEHLRRIPEEWERVLSTLSRGEIHIVLEQKNIDGILEHWEKLVNRVALSLLVGAIVLGLALVVRLHHLVTMPVGEYLFIAALVLAVWVAAGVLRRRRL